MSPPLPPSTPCRVDKASIGRDMKDNVLVMGVHNPNHDTARPPITTFPTFPTFPTSHRGKRTKDRDAKREYVGRGWWKCVVVCRVLFVPL